jgi:hypothetical protein
VVRETWQGPRLSGSQSNLLNGPAHLARARDHVLAADNPDLRAFKGLVVDGCGVIAS